MLKVDLGKNYLLIVGDFNNNKEFIDYNISVINDNDVEFKCFRRYRYFDKLNNILLNKYPFYAIPKLPEKKMRNLLLNTTERENKLNFYLNYLYRHEELRKTDEFTQFIDEFNFVSIYINILLL